MFNYQIIIEYDGTNFLGWQKQKKGRTIQAYIEKTLKKVLNKKINLIGSGRTDKGVHAVAQSANFFTKNEIKKKNKFLLSMNFFLNKTGISLIKICKKKLDFHSRFNAKMRTYTYLISNREGGLVLNKNRAWQIRRRLNHRSMQSACNLLRGKKDFSTFRSASCNARSPIKTIEQAKVIKKQDTIRIIFKSKSFLQQQVRSMVGCIKYVGEGKWSVNNFRKIIRLKRRSSCAPPAPPEGLYLSKVDY